MKKLVFFLIASCMLIACGNKAPRQFAGRIADATMNTVTVQSSADSTFTFSTMDADKAGANGMLIGSPVVVTYSGDLREGATATKVVTDATYAKAVGRWTMPDPIAPAASTMGIEIMVEGQASSINMATLVYRTWELQGAENRIILRGQSIGNGLTADFTENAVISEKDGQLLLSIEGTDVVYRKEVQ